MVAPGARQRADVLVVGGGIIGLACAHRLQQEGLEVTVIERDVCGRHASWAAAGVLQPCSWTRTDPLAELLRRGLEAYPSFAAQVAEESGLDPQYVPCGSFELLFDAQQVERARREVEGARARVGPAGTMPVELLTPEQARQIEPNLSPKIVGVLHRITAAQVRNPRLLRGLHIACLRRGVRVVEGSPVIDLRWEEGRVAGVRTVTQHFEAPWVVLAGGCWTGQVAQGLADQIPVYPVRGQIVLLKMGRRPFRKIIERGKSYLVARNDAHILVGSTEEHGSGYDTRCTVAGISRLLTRALQLVPALGEAELLRSWAGLRPGTPDRHPIIGPLPGAAGVVVATGHFRTGLILAPVTAQIVCDLITKGSSAFDLSRFDPSRFAVRQA